MTFAILLQGITVELVFSAVRYSNGSLPVPYRIVKVRDRTCGFNGGVVVLAIVSIIPKTFVFRMYFGYSHIVCIYSALHFDYPDWYGQTRAK